MEAVTDRVRAYCSWELDAELRREAEGWIASEGDKERWATVQARFTDRLMFGTAGLRAKMGAGWDRMNSVTVMQTSQGVASFLEEALGIPEVRSRGVAVGFDARHGSTLFAMVTAMVFLRRGIRVWFHPKPIPTPLVAFTAKTLRTAAAVVITASHNPKGDNGYKLYGWDACQIIPPQDQQIQQHIHNNQEPWEDYSDTCLRTVIGHELCTDVCSDMIEKYVTEVAHKLHADGQSEINRMSAAIVYSAFHGVGADLTARLFAEFGLPKYTPVTEQLEPDGNFPTVDFPNPEEGEGAMKLSMETADRHQAQVILANDPDADRLAAAEKRPDGSWRLFTEWMWRKHATEREQTRYGMVMSAVSSKFLLAMARSEGFEVGETLTGFKWLAHKAIEMQLNGIEPLLTYEEAIGFMLKDVVWDKDGLSAAAVFAELTADAYHNRWTLSGLLEAQYDKFGYHFSYNGYRLCSDPAKMKNMFERMRDPAFVNKSFAGAVVLSMRDVLRNIDTASPDGKSDLPAASGSEFITLRLRSGLATQSQQQQRRAPAAEDPDVRPDRDPDVVIAFRASGTEPKFKFYSELRSDTGSSSPDDRSPRGEMDRSPRGEMDLPALEAKLAAIVDALLAAITMPA